MSLRTRLPLAFPEPTSARLRLAAWRLAALLSLAVLLTPAGGFAQSADRAPRWNQEHVVALAAKLVTALEELQADPGIRAKQATAMQQREHDAAVTSISELTRLAKDLKRRLDAGYERDEIQPFWEGIELLRGDIGAYASKSWLPESTRTKAQAARELLDALAAYIGEG